MENQGSDKRLVLVVDDEEVNRELLGNILQARYNVEFASDGEEALRVIRRDRNMLSVVLLDLFMPKLDGFEVLKAMSTDDMLRHIPAMVLTGHKEAEVESLELGAYDFITKPFDMPELILARVARTIRLAEDMYIIRETEKDPLTNLPNMSYFSRLCEVEKSRMAKANIRPAFVYFDMQNMKGYNSRYGYAEGDNLLIRLAGCLQKAFTDMPVCRISDDHFAVMTSSANLDTCVADFRARAKDAGKGGAIDLHAGVYLYEDGADTITAIDNARLACITIRGDYNKSICYYDNALLKKYEDRNHVLQCFDQALSERWIKVFYQPIVRSISGNVCNFEALARWQDPERGMLSPGVFIPVIEDYRLGARMDLYIVEEVCREAQARREGGIRQVPVSVNFSRTDFDQCDMVQSIVDITDKYNMPHDMIIIEVTESAFSNNPKYLQEQIDRFHQNGFKVWMDDFGDGYASLNVLQDNSFDLIKLDIGFMRGFDPEGKNGKILTDIVKMAHRLGIHTLCEGVEREDQFLFLQDISCEKIQGFYFGKPRPTSESLENVKNGTALPIESAAEAAHYEKNTTFNFVDYIAQGIPGAILVYQADEHEEILFANQELIDIFECESFADFMRYTRRSFKNIVHPNDLGRVEESIWSQINKGDNNLDYVSYRVVTKNGNVKMVEDIGHLMHDPTYGDIFFVFLYDTAKKENALENA